MREISLILIVAGLLALFAVPARLSIADGNKTARDNVFPNWRTWLVIGMISNTLGLLLLFSR